jgi:hypothetical protein
VESESQNGKGQITGKTPQEKTDNDAEICEDSRTLPQEIGYQNGSAIADADNAV